ncbi:MAG: hypothetical protein ABT10_01170 [Novosphingobium sp. SCN 63-17]|nr:aldo/keto reductase [Novosphingobium sp. SG707]ODU84893.1 MAG: hypothetical protein ABT10_01170 [Novosphingobium sp. SCN 63-17]OJX89327.1 MAG: hypothetical protein BGP00_13905 [Novosphingobium sp. 63-713]
MRPIVIDEPKLSPLGLGAGRIGSFNNPQPLSESIRLLRAALDMGVTTLDTSNIYGQGDSEKAIGAVLAGAGRDRAFVITKGGRVFSPKARALSWLKPVVRPLLAMRSKGTSVTAKRGEVLGFDWSPQALVKSLDGSLRRLRTDRVDGFILHSPPASVAADPAVGEALSSMKKAGKARHVGFSCDDAEALVAALAVPETTMLELPVDLMPVLRQHAGDVQARGIIVIAREVIRMRPDLPPVQAVRTCIDDPLVASALIGTTKIAHLAEIAKALH